MSGHDLIAVASIDPVLVDRTLFEVLGVERLAYSRCCIMGGRKSTGAEASGRRALLHLAEESEHLWFLAFVAKDVHLLE